MTSVSNVSRINLESCTTYWDLWSKWSRSHLIQELHTIAHDSLVLKHEKLLHVILIQYITVWIMMVIYKYTYTLIHNYAFTQHTHIIFSEKFKITVAVCFVQIKTCVTLNNMQHHTGNLQTEIYSILMLCYLLYHTHINFIITTQTSQKSYLCRCKYIPMYRNWTISH